MLPRAGHDGLPRRTGPCPRSLRPDAGDMPRRLGRKAVPLT